MKSRIISIIIVVAVLVSAGLLLKRSHDKINSSKANSGISILFFFRMGWSE